MTDLRLTKEEIDAMALREADFKWPGGRADNVRMSLSERDALVAMARLLLSREPPNRDGDERLVLNAYGRRCYEAGIQTGKREAKDSR